MNKEAEFLVKVVKHANTLITEDFEVKAKDDKGDLVTNFDFEIEQFIINKIKKEYPEFDIVSEEFNADGKLTKNCFVIDPIDGTINFANKLPEWVIQVACVKNGKTIAAVIYAPKFNELYVADDKKAYLNDKEICVNKSPVKKCIFQIDGKFRASAIMRMMPFTKHFRNVGCAGIGYAYVAAGRYGGMIFRNETVWDYLPGIHIARIAGAYIIEEKGCYIAANTKEFAEILKENARYQAGDN